MDFSSEAFDLWQSNYEEFNFSFRRYCFIQLKAYSLHADFVPNVTKQIHEQWVDSCQKWLADRTDHNTTKLSYLKRASLLLHSLVSIQFLGNFKEHTYEEELKFTFRGNDTQYLDSRKDLIDARDAILSLDFVLNIINYFEEHRIDRVEPFRMPLTLDMRHDLLFYLLSGEVDDKALYLILKALYLRNSEGGSAN